VPLEHVFDFAIWLEVVREEETVLRPLALVSPSVRMLPDIVKRSDIRARPRFGPRDLADVWDARDPRAERLSPQMQIAVG
jgi:hypothetical protein